MASCGGVRYGKFDDFSLKYAEYIKLKIHQALNTPSPKYNDGISLLT
jgi:hypothetical protein